MGGIGTKFKEAMSINIDLTNQQNEHQEKNPSKSVCASTKKKKKNIQNAFPISILVIYRFFGCT